MADATDHSANLRRVFLHNTVVRSTEAKGFDRPLVSLQLVDDAARLRYLDFLFRTHDSRITIAGTIPEVSSLDALQPFWHQKDSRGPSEWL